MSFFEGRDDVRQSFLDHCEWGDASSELTAEDWASRRFWRLEKNGKTCILMESVPDDHALSTPGHKIADMLKIGAWLREIDVHVPEVLAVDEDQGFVLMEDLGRETLPLTQEAYLSAADILKTIQAQYEDNALSLPIYKGSRVDVGKRKIIDFLLPTLRGKKNEGGEAEEFVKLWEGIESTLPPISQTFVHIDYAPQNIMWLSPGECGLIDFQGAHYGPTPYDLANLLEDIRRDVPDAMKVAVQDGFCEGMSAEDRDVFDLWYKVLSAQFHCRTAGQVIELYARKGNDRFLEYLPRILEYLKNEFEQEEFKPLREYCTSAGLSFDGVPDITIFKENIF